MKLAITKEYYIEIKYLVFGFWTCPAVGFRIRIGWWYTSAQIGVPNFCSDIYLKLINK